MEVGTGAGLLCIPYEIPWRNFYTVHIEKTDIL